MILELTPQEIENMLKKALGQVATPELIREYINALMKGEFNE